MSKQLSGSLFVDIQGDNKQFKKSIKDSERQVQGFSNTVTSIFAGNQLLTSLLGAGGMVAAIKGFQKGAASHRAFKKMKKDSAEETEIAKILRDVAKRRNEDVKGMTLGEYAVWSDEPKMTRKMKNEAEVDNREQLRDLKRKAAQSKLKERDGQGFLGRTSPMYAGMRRIGAGVDTAGFATRKMAQFMSSGVGLTLAAGAAAAIAGIAINDLRVRSAESKRFNADQIKEDAMTKIARIKQNLAIAKGTYGEGFAGGAARFRDRQSARSAGTFGTVGNALGGVWDTIMGVLHFNMQGGAVRGLFGGSFI